MMTTITSVLLEMLARGGLLMLAAFSGGIALAGDGADDTSARSEREKKSKLNRETPNVLLRKCKMPQLSI